MVDQWRRKNGLSRKIRGLAAGILALVFFSSPGMAELREMSDAELAEVTGAGFTRFTLENDIARAEFNIRAETYTEIADMRMGYYDNGNGPGWDQRWTGVKMGTPERNMVMTGFFFQSAFDNINDPQNRRLLSVRMGFNSVNGTLSAESISSFSGDVGGVLVGGQRVNLDAQGIRKFHFNNAAMTLSIGVEGEQKGLWLQFGEGTTME